VERAVAFYQDKLGLKLLFKRHRAGVLRLRSVRLMLSRPDKAEFDHPSSICISLCRTLRRARKMKESGVQFEDEQFDCENAGP